MKGFYFRMILLVLVGWNAVWAQSSKNIQKEMVSALSGIMNNADKSYSGGEKYKGQLYDGNRHGWGIYYWPSSGSYHIGGNSNGGRSGYGMYLTMDGYYFGGCPDCAVYVGNFDNNKASGKGTCYNESGNLIYYGDFSNDKPVGTYPMSAGSYSSYKFQVLDMADGAKYAGETKDGKRSGWGAYVWKNGGVWYGSWKDGVRGGKGMYSQNNGAWTLQECKGDDCSTISSSSENRVSSSSSNNSSDCRDVSDISSGIGTGCYSCPFCKGSGMYYSFGMMGLCAACGGMGKVYYTYNVGGSSGGGGSSNFGIDKGSSGGGNSYGGSGSSRSSSSSGTTVGNRICPSCGGSGICKRCGGVGYYFQDVGGYTGKTTISKISCVCHGGKCTNCNGKGRY